MGSSWLTRQTDVDCHYASPSPSGSIRENILYGNETATEAEVVEAAKVANAHTFISALPQGYNTNVRRNLFVHSLFCRCCGQYHHC